MLHNITIQRVDDVMIPKVSIDKLIEVVEKGGKIRTGIDIFNRRGRLILEKDVLVCEIKPLLNVKKFGVSRVPIVSSNAGGVWDKNGKGVSLDLPKLTPDLQKEEGSAKKSTPGEVDRIIQEICEMKDIASKKYRKAKSCIKQVLASIQETGGDFDCQPIQDTVSDLCDFVSINDNAFSYLTREIFTYNDYELNHSINVCTIGTVVMNKFNRSLNAMVNNSLQSTMVSTLNNSYKSKRSSFSYCLPDDLRDISMGFFLHDMGMVLVDKQIINKEGKLTDAEFELVKSHSLSKGVELLERNGLANPYFKNISLYHHAKLFDDEVRCYPKAKKPEEVPPYVKVCKLADIYDAMTSKRSYKEAHNPVEVVAEIFYKYAEKDRLLQMILHSFVKAVGICPPGSIVGLTNGQLAYVLDSEGPTLLPITDISGQTLRDKPDLLVLEKDVDGMQGVKIDRRKPLLSPIEAYKILPTYLVKTLFSDKLPPATPMK